MMLMVLIVAALQAPQALPVQAVVRDDSRSRSAKVAVKVAPRPKMISRVVVDAGHGGRDPGGPMRFGERGELYEKDIVLQVALKLGEELRERGVDVYYTRSRDTLIALDDRGRMANRANGDLFISIHVNAANPRWKNPTAARGYETYFLAEAKTEDAQRVEEMENEAARFETNGESAAKDDPLSFILSDMRQNEHLRESSDLAEIVQRHLGGVHPGPNRGVKQAGFRVLVGAFMPAVLLELGFGTNGADAEFLASPIRQRAIARAVADATMEYLERHQRRIGGGDASGEYD
jgi:N-acetylmuramoyl-L-alanine amidase